MFAKRTPISLAAILLLGAGPAAAGEAKAHGDHHHHEAGSATLKLNDGRKWATDAVLRKHMEAFQATLAEKIPAIHEGKLDAAGYADLAGKLEEHLHAIMGECRLAPEADAQFHVLLVEFFAGIQAMKGDGDRMKGAVQIVRGLGTYETFFEHPGFEPPKHG